MSPPATASAEKLPLVEPWETAACKLYGPYETSALTETDWETMLLLCSEDISVNVSVKLRQRRIPAVYCGRIYLVLFNSETKAVSVSKKPGETKSVAFF